MSIQINILKMNTQTDGSFSVSGIFWLVTPANRIIQNPTFASQVPNTPAATLLALQAGTLTESWFDSGLFAPDSSVSDVKLALQSLYATAQQDLINGNPPVSGLIGLAFDGTNWVSGSAASFVAPVKPPITSDGRAIVKTSTANRTNNFKLRTFSFQTSSGSGSIHNVNPVNNLDHGDMTLTMYDVNGSVTLDPTQSVKDVVDFMPTYNYEIIGGFADLPQNLLGTTPGQWFIAAIGVPEVPAQYGGQIDFISEVDIALVTAVRVESDGVSVSYMPYNYAGMNTNKLRFIIKHPIGAVRPFQIYLRHFV
jgi:hypothetical protein